MPAWGSSIAEEQVSHLFDDGICKVNISDCFGKRQLAGAVQKNVRKCDKIVGPEKAREIQEKGFIGKNIDVESSHSIKYYTSKFRREIVFKQMQEIVLKYLNLLYK